MIVKINDEQKEFPQIEADKVREFVMQLGARVLETGDVTTDIKVELVPELEGTLDGDAILELPLEKIKSVFVETVSFANFIDKQTEIAKSFVQALSESFGKVSDHLYHDDVDLGMRLFKECIEGLALFFQLLKDLESALGLDFENIKVEGMTLSEHIKKFNGTLKELLDAMEQNDLVLINDYIKYELVPDLDKWTDRVEHIRKAVA